jgi:hypothetical protein
MAKAKIMGPTKDPSDHGYQSECQFVLEPFLSKLLDEAVAAGWPKREVAYALMVLGARELNTQEKT